MRLIALLLCFVVGFGFAAPKKTDAQIKEQKTALKKLESDLAKKRKELAQLETEEKGVLNTISLLDQNLNQTRNYIYELSKSEVMVQQAVEQLGAEIDSLDKNIHARKEVMKKRIRTLYIKGRSSEAEILYTLLTKKGNPERQVYWVHHILNQDREQVETLSRLMQERDEKKKQEEEHLAELNDLRSKKSVEEKGLVTQMNGQEKMLTSLKQDKAMQQQALAEFERNQKTMLALIKKLEQKRKKEIEAAKKAEAERKKKGKKKGAEKPKPTVVTSVKGPKCTPMEGEIISHYGLQEHPVLHIQTRNLGVEIRGKRGGKIKAAAPGTVVMVAEIDGRGPSVIIEHEGGTYSVYGHMSSIKVQEGKEVKNCEEIGVVGDIASLNGIKLYFQVSEGTQTVDPLEWLKTK
ncbi:MAG: peptidoglycan DD-metalloendopeptidase family protein [Fibrobacter sp.]|nr:peptidoglycan DD-metalloendopeptidase family protein [Fibrobacter sp.]